MPEIISKHPWVLKIPMDMQQWIKKQSLADRDEILRVLSLLERSSKAPTLLADLELQAKKFPSYSPALYQLNILTVTPELAFLYSVKLNQVIFGGWGTLSEVSSEAARRSAEQIIREEWDRS